ncbi:hypothetical protein HK105_200888 [Polyrhizophydium stewartii]|uniref:Uncharacterized protein n=1 Tax=Polyrhizophydium stewartii TaxID=2732419 RepID=A0ABR4NIE7_9FUNG
MTATAKQLALLAALAAGPVAAQWFQSVTVSRCTNGTFALPSENSENDSILPASAAGATPVCIQDFDSTTVSTYYELSADSNTVTAYRCTSGSCATGTCTATARVPTLASATNPPQCGLYFSLLTTTALLTTDALVKINKVNGAAGSASAYYLNLVSSRAAVSQCKAAPVAGQIIYAYETCTQVGTGDAPFVKTQFDPVPGEFLTTYKCTSSDCATGCTAMYRHRKPSKAGTSTCFQYNGLWDVAVGAGVALKPTSEYSLPNPPDVFDPTVTTPTTTTKGGSTGSSSPTPSGSASGSDSGSSGLGIGAIIGIVAGVVVVLGAGIGFFLFRRNASNNARPQSPPAKADLYGAQPVYVQQQFQPPSPQPYGQPLMDPRASYISSQPGTDGRPMSLLSTAPQPGYSAYQQPPSVGGYPPSSGYEHSAPTGSFIGHAGSVAGYEPSVITTLQQGQIPPRMPPVTPLAASAGAASIPTGSEPSLARGNTLSPSGHLNITPHDSASQAGASGHTGASSSASQTQRRVDYTVADDEAGNQEFPLVEPSAEMSQTQVDKTQH